jgi:hypothetical protein
LALLDLHHPGFIGVSRVRRGRGNKQQATANKQQPTANGGRDGRVTDCYGWADGSCYIYAKGDFDSDWNGDGESDCDSDGDGKGDGNADTSLSGL